MTVRRIDFRPMAAIVCATLLAVATALPADAQNGDRMTDTISFDRPEAWALKYFASATLLSGLGSPRSRPRWSVSFGAELGWIPPISPAKRVVGFDGTRPEDLNKAPVFVRPRVTIGLPGRFSMIVAGVPPIRSFGVTPRLLAVAVERPIRETQRWIVGWRAYGQIGTAKGAYTCPSSVLSSAPGSQGNLYGCEAESADTATLRYAGGQLAVAHRTDSKLSPHIGVALNYLAVAFQVKARTFGFLDRTHYVSHGLTFAGSAGFTYRLSPRLDASVDAFYTPLSVRRPSGRETDPFFNVRMLVSYALRK